MYTIQEEKITEKSKEKNEKNDKFRAATKFSRTERQETLGGVECVTWHHDKTNNTYSNSEVNAVISWRI